MKKAYKIGDKEAILEVEARIGTPGIAHTKVFQFLPGGQYKMLAQSGLDSGSINKVVLGKSSDLEGSYLKIRTIVDFGSISDSSSWEDLVDKISGKYAMYGGYVEKQSYSYDEDDKTHSNNYQFAIIDMEIDIV